MSQVAEMNSYQELGHTPYLSVVYRLNNILHKYSILLWEMENVLKYDLLYKMQLDMRGN